MVYIFKYKNRIVMFIAVALKHILSHSKKVLISLIYLNRISQRFPNCEARLPWESENILQGRREINIIIVYTLYLYVYVYAGIWYM